MFSLLLKDLISDFILGVQNSVKSICIHRSLVIEVWFSKKKASFLENHVCKKGQVKVTLFPGMVFQERIIFFFRKLKLND